MTAGDASDEEPAGKRRRGDMWSPILRVDCTNIPRQDAERWIREYSDVVRVTFGRIRSGLSRTAGIDAEDVASVGYMAILEACTTYDPNNEARASLRTWVGSVVHWRMSRLLDRLTRQKGEIVDHAWAQHVQEREQIDEFEERMEALERLRVLAENFGRLPHRTKIILLQRLEGASSEETATSLGISVFREQQIVARSRAALREALVLQDGMVTGPTVEASTSEV